MTVTVLLFASYREKAGERARQLELPEGSTVRDAAREVERAFAGLPLQGALCAVNEAYASPDAVLADGDTVAFFPPVSGGQA
jgi:molybdopterin converting factor subunit 1